MVFGGDEEKVYYSIKNVSREMLNISADELTERFVRGDKSRYTEGSGLGLSIARNLTGWGGAGCGESGGRRGVGESGLVGGG